MPKYFSGRNKRTPQSGLTTDRYQYLSIEQAEPNLGDPPEIDNIPTGNRYQVISVQNHPGERYWLPIGGGVQPGAITVREEETILPTGANEGASAGVSSITDINFKGNILTAEGYLDEFGNPGVGVTITAAPIGKDHDVIFNNNGEFGAATGGLTYDNDNTRVGIASTQPDQTLDIDGSLFIGGNVFDKSKTNSGTENQVLVRSATGGLVWADQSATGVPDAAGDPTQVQFHDSTGKLGGGTLLVYDYTHGSTDERVGIGSTQPTRLLDVLGDSRFVGVTTFVGNVFVEGVVTSEDVTNIDSLGIVTARKGVRVDDDGLIVVGVTTLENTKILYNDSNGNALYFGADDDTNTLEIKFDGTDSVINDVSTANLGFKLQQGGNTKLEVTGAGVTVTGVTTTNILSVTGLVTSHLIPSPTNVGLFDLGSPTNRWDNIYANNINVGTYSPVSLVVEQLKVTGISTLSNLEVSGMSTFIGLSTFSDGLEVISGVTTFSGITTVSGETLFTKQFSVAGVSSIGIGSANSLYVSGLSTFVGFSTFKDDVFVAGVSTFIGFTTFRDYVHVTGVSTFVGFSTFQDVIVGGMSTFVGISSFEGNVSFNAGIRDKDGDLGGPTDGYILESRDSKINWVNPQGLTVENADKVGIGSTDKDSIYYPAFVKNNNEHDDRQNEYLYNTHDFIYSYDGNAGIGSVGIGTDIIADDTTLNVTGITSFKGNVYFNGTDENNLGVTSLTWQRATGILKFKDEVKAYFGNGNDLRIYHTNELKDQVDSNGESIVDGRTSYIREKGSGGIVFRTDGSDGPGAFQFFGENDSLSQDWVPLLKVHSGSNARVRLYHTGTERLRTIGTGVTITGITTTNDLSVSGIASFWGPVWDETGSPGAPTYLLEATSTGVNWKAPENLTVENANKVGVGTTGAVSVGGTSIYYPTFVNSNNTEGRDLEYLYSGNALTYNVHYVDGDDVGIGSIGIGTTTPNSTLDVLGITSFRGNVYFNGIDINDGSVGITSITWSPSNSALEFKDNVKATFGDDNDLQIYHDTNDTEPNSVVEHNNPAASALYLSSNQRVEITDENHVNLSLRFNNTGNYETELFHGTTKRFETIGTGVTITGITTTNDLSVSGIASFWGPVWDSTGSYGAQSGFILETNQESGVRWVSPSDLTLENANKVGVGSINAADAGIGTHFITFVDSNNYPTRENEKIYSTGLFVYDPQDHGRVGIGTTIPSDTLSVLGISSFKGDVYFNGTDENNLGITSLTWRRSAGILEFKTNVIARFGDDDGDNNPGLEIYHDGTDSIIHDNGEGNLNLKTGDSSIQLLSNDTESMVVAKANSSVELYYDSVKKLETSGIGITVTGITSTNQLMVTGAFYDKDGDSGGENQVLASTGAGAVDWIDPDSLSADSANRIKTCGVTTDRTYHLTFVEDNNTSSSDPNPGALEQVYTGVGITFNANNDYLYLGGSLHLDGTGADTDGDIHSWGGSDGEFTISNEGSGAIHLLVQDNDPNTAGIGIVSFTAENNAKKTYFESNVNPKAHQTYNLAESNIHRWANVHAQNYHGEFLNIYDSNSTNKITLQSPATGNLTADYTLTLPVDAGSADGDVLQTDGNGVLSWTTNSPGTPTAAGDDKQVQFNDKSSGSNVLSGAAELLFTKSDTAPNLVLKSKDTDTASNGGYIQVRNAGSTNTTLNAATINSEGGLELKRTNESVAGGGPFIDFKYDATDMDARIQMDIASGTTSDDKFSAIRFSTGGGGIYDATTNTSGRVTEKLRIGKDGEIGIQGGAQVYDASSDTVSTNHRTSAQIYGTQGQVLKSNGLGASVYWDNEGTGSGISAVQVKQYSDDLGTGPGQSTPRTQRTCDAPITVATSGNTATIGIGSTSNAYGSRYIGDTEPTGNLCEGDIWYDTSSSGSGGVNGSTGVTKVAIIRDQKNSNVDGGYTDKVATGENGSWNDRDLTVKDDPFSFVTLYPTANGQTTYSRGKTPGYFSLPAGTYKIRFKTGGIQLYEHLGSLIWSKTQSDISSEYDWTTNPAQNFVDGGYCLGTTALSKGYNPSASIQNYDLTYSTGSTVVTITETSYFKVVHYSNNNPGAEYAFGSRIHSSVNNIDKNNYTIVEVEDLATAVKEVDVVNTGITKVATVKDVKAYDANGGTFAAATWVHRTLNTLSDPHSIGLSISGNIVTVPAGTYSMRWRAPAYLCNRFTSRLAYSSTSTTVASGITYVDGTTGYSHQSDGKSVEESFGEIASITFSATTYLKIEQYSATGYTAQESGLGVSSGISGVDSVFTTLEIEDLATAIKEGSGGGSSALISVKDYGAVGDGSTDDTASIQTAINATSALKQRLYIPAGTYIVSSLSLLNNTYLFGVGTLKRKASSAGFVITASSKNNCILKGFTIDGNKSAVTDATKAAIRINGGYQIVIDGITVTNHNYDGISITNTTDRTQKTESYIKNCTVSDSERYGIEVQDVKDLTIIGNLISNLSGASNPIQNTGISIFGTSADKTDLVTVEGNTVIDAGGAGISAPYFYTDPGAPYPVGYFGVSKVQIIDNKVKGSGYNGIVVQTNNGIVSNNICDDNGTTTGHQGILINGHYITVDGNSSINNKGVGIDVGDGKFVTVTNNIVNNNVQIGIEINSCESCIVDGNIVRSNWLGDADADAKIRAGILVQEDTGQFIGGCKDITVSNNEVKTGTNQAYGISVLNPYGARVSETDPTDRVSIIGNSLTGSGSTRALNIETDNGTFICEKNIDYLPGDIASATSITVDQNTNFAIVTGTTTITSIVTDTAKYQRGRMLTILFTGALQVTDGPNLKLNGNLTTSDGTTLTLVAKDSKWYEVSRSINS